MHNVLHLLCEFATPNHALEVTAGLAISFRSAAVTLPGSVTGCASAAAFPPAMPSPRLRLAPPCSVSALSGPPHLSLGALGVSELVSNSTEGILPP